MGPRLQEDTSPMLAGYDTAVCCLPVPSRVTPRGRIGGNRASYPCQSVSPGVTTDATDAAETEPPAITSEAYHITVDGGEDSFYALCIEREDSETAYLMSDTVRSLDAMR